MITLGIDIGSLTGKALVLRDRQILAWEVILTGPDSVETGQEVTRRALAKAGLTLDAMDFTVSTGYGRIVVPFADKNVSEISCHARGASHIFPGARTILDMGGQDCKAIRCDGQGKVTDFAMNDKCAAGAGRSMGIVAELVKVPLADLGPLSLEAKEREGDGVPVSSTCVVFARSEIVAYLRGGVPKSEILAGSCAALSSRVQALLRRVGIEEEFVISGGIAKNPGVVRRLEGRLGMTPRIAEEPQIVGALGAALFAADLFEKRAQKGEGRGRSERRERLRGAGAPAVAPADAPVGAPAGASASASSGAPAVASAGAPASAPAVVSAGAPASAPAVASAGAPASAPAVAPAGAASGASTGLSLASAAEPRKE